MSRVKVPFFSVLLAISVLTFGGTAQAAAPTCSNMVGAWKNQLDSTLIVAKIDPSTKLVSGCYCSPSGTSGTWFRATGWFNSLPPVQNNAQLISWAVQWGQIGSITTWSGTCQSAGSTPTITSLWYLTRSNSSYSWDHRLAGTDTFVPTGTPTCPNVPSFCQ